MTFKNAVASAATPLKQAFKHGKQALGSHAGLVTCTANTRITGSVEVDNTLRRQYPNENRWDYGLGYSPPGSEKEFAVWIEVHSAYTSEVSVVLRKLSWLKIYLATNASELWAMTPQAGKPCVGFVWIATNGNHILPNTSQARQLALSAIGKPVSRLQLP